MGEPTLIKENEIKMKVIDFCFIFIFPPLVTDSMLINKIINYIVKGQFLNHFILLKYCKTAIH